MSTISRFPSPAYAETVLSINFTDAQRFFLDALLEIQYAHTIMLAEQGIIPAAAARACLKALNGLDREAVRSCRYDVQFEDLFFYVEEQLQAACGLENAGRMHTARSRNDLAIAMYRMVLRKEVLSLIRTIHETVDTLVGLAGQHLDTLMPAYTHTQPAQPTTLAHYLLGAIECFQRDEGRLQAAFRTINRSPLGACAITTTGFPIDRHRTEQLLRFEGLQLNSYGAIAAVDYVTETAAAVAVAAVNLGKLVQDLLLWCNPELNFLRLSDAWVQISSIMPQKRNPVALEHVRILASKTVGQAQAVFTAVHNTPFGDIVDSEDDLQPLVFAMMTDSVRAFRLFSGLMSDCEINTKRMRERAGADFLTVTELADSISREEGVSFRAAHHLVSDAVRALNGDYSPTAMARKVAALSAQILGRELQMSGASLGRALDPKHFVDLRGIPGGPARRSLEPELLRTKEEGNRNAEWIRDKAALLESYPAEIRKVTDLRLKQS